MALQHLLREIFHSKEKIQFDNIQSIPSRLTLSLQHLKGGLGSSSGLSLRFGQELSLFLQTLLPLLFLLLLLLLAFLL